MTQMVDGLNRAAKSVMSKVFQGSYAAKVERLQEELQSRFNDFCEVKDHSRLSLVHELIGQEGTVDMEVEGLSSAENQRDLTIKFHWGHNHRFTQDIHQLGRMGDRHVNLAAQFIEGFHLGSEFFQGKSCIDVGSWTGGTTLMLKCLGAERVLALEEVKKYSVTTNRLCKELYELDGVTSDGTNLYQLQVSEKFDIAYFPGVIYHLSDPVLGLRRLFNSLVDGGVCLVETAGIYHKGSIARFDGNRIYHKSSDQRAEELNRGGWNWFLPSPLCLERWMIEAGFNDVRCYYSFATNRIFGYGKRTEYVDICRAGFAVPDIE